MKTLISVMVAVLALNGFLRLMVVATGGSNSSSCKPAKIEWEAKASEECWSQTVTANNTHTYYIVCCSSPDGGVSECSSLEIK